MQYVLISHGHGQPSLKSWLQEEREGVGEEELAASAEGEEWVRKVILVLSVLRLVLFLLLLQHDETRMLHVYRKYVSIVVMSSNKSST